MQPVTREKNQLMSASEIDRTLVRLAHEILEKTEDLAKLAFIGIRRRGVPLAARLAEKIKQLHTTSEIDRTLVRLAHEILKKTEDLAKLAFIGIRRRGVPLAARLAEKIKSLEKLEVPVGILDINLYRDDLSTISEKPVH